MVTRIVPQLGVPGELAGDFKFTAGYGPYCNTGRLVPNAGRSVTLERPSTLGFQAYRFHRSGILLEASHPVELPTTDSWRTAPWQKRRPGDTMSVARALIIGNKGIAMRDSEYDSRSVHVGNAIFADFSVTPIRFAADDTWATGGIILRQPNNSPSRGASTTRSVHFLANLDLDVIPSWEQLGQDRKQRFYYAPHLGDVAETVLSAEEMDKLLNGAVIYDNG